jgi:hypothetical protein
MIEHEKFVCFNLFLINYCSNKLAAKNEQVIDLSGDTVGLNVDFWVIFKKFFFYDFFEKLDKFWTFSRI